MAHDSRSAGGAGRSDNAFGRALCLTLRAPWAPALAAAAGLGAALLYAWPYSVDDAHIVARYARRLAGGQGYTFSEGPPSDGVTGPLWLGLGALWAAAGGDPLAGAKALGAACTLVVSAWLPYRERGRCGGRCAAWVLALLLATSVPLAIWAVAGLETGLATLALAGLALGPPRARTLAACALPWLRPELVPAGFVLAVSASASPRLGRAGLLAALLLGLGSVTAFRALSFGHLWPMTASAKPAQLDHGLVYLGEALRAPAALQLAVAAGLAARRVRGGTRLAVALAVHGLAVALAGGDWMPAARLFVPGIPLAAVLAARGVARVAPKRRAQTSLALAACAVLRVLSLCADLPPARAVARHAPVLDALVAALPPGTGPLVALDVGWLGARVPGRIVDLGGLTEPAIAYAPGGHLEKRVDAAWLERQAPRALILHSRVAPRSDAEGRLRWFAGYPVEQRVLGFPWVQREFRVLGVFRYDAAYFYVLMGRRAPAER